MSDDFRVPEVAHIVSQTDTVDGILELIRDLSHRARLLDELLASARDPRMDADRVLVDLDASLWLSAAAAVVAVRAALPPRQEP